MTSSNSAEQSPLSQVKVDSLERLFNTMPDELTDEEVGKICDVFIADRKRFLESQKAGSSKSKKVAAEADLNVDDLDINI